MPEPTETLTVASDAAGGIRVLRATRDAAIRQALREGVSAQSIATACKLSRTAIVKIAKQPDTAEENAQ